MEELEGKKETRTWRSFTEARAFVRALGLKSKAQWQAYAKSGKRPHDIPSNPDKIYPTEFRGFGDWLGTGAVASFNRQYRSFQEARAFVHTLNFKSCKQWREYCSKSGQKPPDIPTMPERYGPEFKGYGDWLGTGNVAPTKRVFRPFTEARTYVRNLKLKNQDAWLDYCRSGQRPLDIPANPDSVYLADFVSYGDWVGNENVSTWNRVYRPFAQARDFVRELKLENSTQWYTYCRSGEKPADIPAHPEQVYRADYLGMDDWLGTGRIRHYRPFAETRIMARSLGLSSYAEWIAYCRSGKKPPDIPAEPWRTYRLEYTSLADWLGTQYLSFSEARAFVRTLGLKNHQEWRTFCRSSMRPKSVPSKPEQVYRAEYKGMKDWLGVIDKWNCEALLAFLRDLQPRLGSLSKKDLVLVLQRNDTLNPLRKALGGTTPARVLNDLLKNGGRNLERALVEIQNGQREFEMSVNNRGNDEVRDTHPQSVWESLLKECQRLENIASQLQPINFNNIPVDSSLSADKLEQLIGDYYSWYGECLSVLQDDLKEKFRIAYDGGNVSPYVCIQRFLDAPLDTYLRRKTDVGWRSERAYETKWKYSYEKCFRNPLRTQRQILVEASKRKPAANGLSECDPSPPLVKGLELSEMKDVSTMSSDPVTDIVIITALKKEQDAVLRHLVFPQEVKTKGRTFYKASVRVGKSDRPYQIVLLTLPGIGNLHASVATQEAISVWNPSYIILTGIAGGVRKEDNCYLGDILVGEQIVSYELGKQTESGIQRRYDVYRPARILLEAAKHLPPQHWALSTIVPRPDGTTGRVIPNVHFGVVASGEKVVTDAALTNELQSHWSQIVGIEMEGAGTALAVAYDTNDLPGILLVKGMCDWADKSKNDDWQEYAADVAACFVIKLLESGPFEGKVKPQPIRKDRELLSNAGRVKMNICKRLVQDWPDLADYFDIPPYACSRWEKGREAHGVWEWLEQREKLLELEGGLRAIGRTDLVSLLYD